MRWLTRAPLLVLLLGTLQAAAQAGAIRVDEAWSRPTPPAADVGVVYFHISNLGSGVERLLSLSTPIAAQVQLHESVTVNGVIQMRERQSLDCPPGLLKIEPGGLHVMLIGLRQPLVAGSEFALTLMFRDAGPVTVNVAVKNPP